MNTPAFEIPEDGRLGENILWFTRALRKAGLPLGPGTALTALQAVQAVGFSRREDFYHSLRAVMISRPEHRVVFDQMFRLFWRDPRYMEHMMALLLPSMRGTQEERSAAPAARRAAEALTEEAALPDLPPLPESEETQIEVDASGTASATETLRQLDFEQMSLEEAARARRLIARLSLPVDPMVTRRQVAGPGAFVDRRATLRRALRSGGEVVQIARRRRARRWPALVVICDISGSMSDYSRMVLHFAHTLANRPGDGWSKVHAFTFGTRLTNITRHLAQRDVDAALAAAGAEAQDWRGGTRIGASLASFNRTWGRRVLSGGAVVLLITDGLDRDAPDQLSREVARLRRSCRRLIWLNPLLRWEGFSPKARGIAAMLPHVDCFRAAHSIASLEALAGAVSDARDQGEKARLMQLIEENR
ncbi:VWA domain-containing protein [Falsigemmobacter intermedius]|uniref:VWA domain-containing protein n=1 Tax=Falsigemmobacter intermedius TaxID=1553448 RepID=A0A3S3U676_9RHOB|nr:VWA domain-containing protein [Falsigemmobacter intermedius]RWY38176.1 VWA domain-containing protein [Falsigemmobacter intermedius]